MLSVQDNELLTRTGRGTPMGELFRRFWLPACLTEDLPDPDGTPVRLRILNEDLVAFRDTYGHVGIVQQACPHRRASLYWGRNEEGGLRCVYHGWKFDANGDCVDMPSEPDDSNFKAKVRIDAYPTHEFGDVIWIYMGPAELKPQVPQLEWARIPSANRRVSRWIQENNYMQALEGEIDTAHASFLHSVFENGNAIFSESADWTPHLTIRETDYGMIYGARRRESAESYYWRATQWMLPAYALIPGGDNWPRLTHFYVPIDDENVTAWETTYNPEAALTQPQWADAREKMELEPVVYKMADGNKIDIWRSVRNKDNDYLIDREMQKTTNFTGIQGVRRQDMALVESMVGTVNGIVDRNLEHLGTSDAAIITARRRLLRMARELLEGVEPAAAYDGDLYHIRAIGVRKAAEDEFDAFLDVHGSLGAAVV